MITNISTFRYTSANKSRESIFSNINIILTKITLHFFKQYFYRNKVLLFFQIYAVESRYFIKIVNVLFKISYFCLVYSGCRMTFYEIFREKLLKTKSNGAPPLW